MRWSTGDSAEKAVAGAEAANTETLSQMEPAFVGEAATLASIDVEVRAGEKLLGGGGDRTRGGVALELSGP